MTHDCEDCVEWKASYTDLLTKTQTLKGLFEIAEREHEKLKQEIEQLETVIQRQKEQLRSVVKYYRYDPQTGEVYPVRCFPQDFTGQAE